MSVLSTVSKDILFQEVSNGYWKLHERRWQYFTTILAVHGLVLTSWKNIIDDDVTLSAVGTTMVLVASCMLMLVSRIRLLIQEAAIRMNRLAGMRIVRQGAMGRFSFRGATIYAYSAMNVVAVFWIGAMGFMGQRPFWSAIWYTRPACTGASLLILLLANCLIYWRCPVPDVKDCPEAS